MSQIEAFAPSRRVYKRTIQAMHLCPVADVVDPEHGPEEIPPSPGYDSPGTVYIVGREREIWTVGADWIVCRPDGSQIAARDAVKQMMRRGARLMRLARRFGEPDLVRADERSPLVEEGWEMARRHLWTVPPNAPVEGGRMMIERHRVDWR